MAQAIKLEFPDAHDAAADVSMTIQAMRWAHYQLPVDELGIPAGSVPVAWLFHIFRALRSGRRLWRSTIGGGRLERLLLVRDDLMVGRRMQHEWGSLWEVHGRFKRADRHHSP